MSDIKQVKVDNWGIYFLQRLKHFFNRTDYCDLTLQFQDNAQLKVHRLVLNSCTEYFEILERTCEMYSDCLVMPDDLQADVVVPIVNFMYTGQLEFKIDLLEKLYQTSLIMNMPVLTKLLDAHRTKPNLYGKRYSRSTEPKQTPTTASKSSQPKKRTFVKAFENEPQTTPNKNKYTVSGTDVLLYSNGANKYDSGTSEKQKKIIKDPKPTRYELPAELDDDNIFDNSFTSLSYESKPLMVHPETTKYYTPKKNRIFDEPSSSKRFLSGTSTMDIVECRKILQSDIFDDIADGSPDDSEAFLQQGTKEKKDSSQLFDQVLIKDSKVSIERKDKETSHLDHAKIISEVLKKYPHLMKSNKNIKLKILNTPNSQKKMELKSMKPKPEVPDYTYETDVVDSQEAARLIALGAENVKGPWICLICGTPGRALHFTSYYNYRRHLVDVHNEKPVSNICEYCGLKSLKRNYLVHHLYTKHGIEPPRQYNFPKCNICSYVALTEAFLAKHKMSHTDNRNFRCTVCVATFPTSNSLLQHIQKTGHKFSGEKKPSPQCIYCFKVFTRDSNLYAHLKANHYEFAKRDGVIEDSDDEKSPKSHSDSIRDDSTHKYIEVDVPSSFERSYEDTSYKVEHRLGGNIEIVTKKPYINLTPVTKKKILNSHLLNKSQSSNASQKVKILQDVVTKTEFMESPKSLNKEDNIVLIDNEYILSDTYPTEAEEMIPSITRPEYSNVHQIKADEPKLTLAKTNNMNQPIQIVVSNEEEYKALLSSNHSIIFDDGTSDKALTVLTASNHSNVGDTINLNNAQSSDMMIIRENYPLNISEPSTTDNSNIVVVYSHPVNDQNKHYQLITSSQGIEGQFVQSSAIFTQNYETVTTSTPIVGAHVVNNPVENSWQNSMPIVTSEMQVITAGTHQEANPDIVDLPQVEIAEQAIEVPITQQFSNLHETVITSGNNFVNINHDPTIQTLTEVAPSTTYQAAAIIPVTAISTISSVNEPMVVDTFQEVASNDIEPQTNVIMEQHTETFEQPIINIEQPCDSIIEQQPDVDEEQKQDIPEQYTDIVLEQEPVSIMETKVEMDIEQEPEASVIDQQSAVVIEQPTACIEQQSDANMENHSNLEEETNVTSIQQQPILENQQIEAPMNEIQEKCIINESEIIAEPELSGVTAEQDQPVPIEEQKPDANIIQQPNHLDAPKEESLEQDPNLNIVTSENTDVTKEEVKVETSDIDTNELEIFGVDANEVDKEMERIHANDIQEQIQGVSVEIVNIAEQGNNDVEETIENIARDIGIDPTISAFRENVAMSENIDTPQKPIIKEIASLTSEWSEDEAEENTADPSIRVNEDGLDNKEEITQDANKTEANKDKNITAPLEKISSLLNDWEDNDSQEGTVNVMPVPTEMMDNSVDTNKNITKDTESEANEKVASEPDNIRKLVSDWDEDDEEDNKV